MELGRLCNLEEEPHLSGAYIRSLVKQLTTSKAKESMNPINSDCIVAGDTSQARKSTKQDRVFEGHQPKQPAQPRQHKKQVRRRLHTALSHKAAGDAVHDRTLIARFALQSFCFE